MRRDRLLLLLAVLAAAAGLLLFRHRTPPTAGPLPSLETVSGRGILVEDGAVYVDINTADAELLQSLPGIGPAIAGRILEWREANGPFASPEGLLAVSGIGEKTLSNLLPEIAASLPAG